MLTRRSPLADVRLKIEAAYRVLEYCGCGYCGCRHEVRNMNLWADAEQGRHRMKDRAMRASRRRAAREISRTTVRLRVRTTD